MNSKFQGTKHLSHHFSQIFGMQHKYSLYPVQSETHFRFKVILFQYRKVTFQDHGFKTCTISYGHIMCMSNTSGCKIEWFLTCNNEQTKVNSWHNFGIKHCNKITASELLNYSSQIDICDTVLWKFTEWRNYCYI